MKYAYRNIVAEVTDDKSLPKQERKRLQIVTAPHKSTKAKLVKLADKLYNLRDLNRCTPEGRTGANFVAISLECKALYSKYFVLRHQLGYVLENSLPSNVLTFLALFLLVYSIRR